MWYGQVARALDLIGETLITLDVIANGNELAAVTARKVARLLRDLEAYICGQSNIIIDYASAQRQDELISTPVTESAVQWLLYRRMNARQHMRWSPRGAHLMLKARTSIVNGTFDRDRAVGERWARRPYRRATSGPPGSARSPRCGGAVARWHAERPVNLVRPRRCQQRLLIVGSVRRIGCTRIESFAW